MTEYVVFPDGTQGWYDPGGLLHREDGPALIYPDDARCWYRNGRCHRDNGPAVIYPNGRQEWWIDGELVDPLVAFVSQKDIA